ncbi:ChbG/HpnK family deacetylase [bacterium]|nr:ChbG/HpnK family deacetylase [bacterium]
MKKFILNADDFGLSEYHNRAVLYGYESGILKSASLMVNTSSFSEAVSSVIPNCPDLNIGIHLNIMEGKALTDCPLLTDKNGNFNKSYLYLILKQYDKNFKKQVEAEFRAQIEKALQNGVEIKHLDSHVHTHAVPELFKIACELAKTHNIPYIRTQMEKPYLVFPRCFSIKFLINLVKVALLNFFSSINKKILIKYNLKTNDNIIGVCYTGMMNSKTVSSALKQYENKLVEIIIHPCFYEDGRINSHSKEFLITQDETLKANFLNNT